MILFITGRFWLILNWLQRNTVAYNEGHTVKLENKLLLGDAISDLPEVKKFIVAVSMLSSIMILFEYLDAVAYLLSSAIQVPNDESRDEIKYDRPPETEFQRFIRLTKEGNLSIGLLCLVQD